MKTLYRVLVLFSFLTVFTSSAFGQDNDLNVWSKKGSPLSTYIWYVHYGHTLAVDARYNYDADKTAGFCLGKTIGPDAFAVVPEICGYAGKTNGYGPELLMFSETKHLLVFSQSQFLKGTGNKSIAYNWTDVHVVATEHVALGAGGQAWKEIGGDPTTVDVGPSVKLTFGKTYFRAWPKFAVDSANRGQKSLYFGMGFVW